MRLLISAMRLQTAAAAGIAACLLLVMLTAAGAAPAAAPSQPFSTHSITTSTSHTPFASQLQAERVRQLIGDKADTKLSKPPPAREAPQPLTCPSTEETLDPNDDNDLSSVANTAGITYLLPPGIYTISSTILLGSTTCYRGVPGTAQRGAGSSAVTILVDPAICTTGRAFIVGDGAGLVLEYLLLDGQASTGGVQGVNSALEITGVTMQGFRQTAGNSAAFGSAISLEGSTVRITGTVFADNAAEDVGGAVFLTESNAALEKVRFEGNSAALGGAMFLASSLATLVDDITFTNNSATQGGAVYLVSSNMFVAGSLCATSNTAGLQAGFAEVFLSLLEFSEGSGVNSNGNTPDTVVLIPPASQLLNTVRCGTGPSWASGITQDVFASFNITGQMCACNDEFVTSNLTMQSCDSCGGRGFDTEQCACRDPECDKPGKDCCQPNRLFSLAGTVCRHGHGPCDPPDVCSGVSATCPDLKEPNGTPCHKMFAHNTGHNDNHAYTAPGHAENTVEAQQAPGDVKDTTEVTTAVTAAVQYEDEPWYSRYSYSADEHLEYPHTNKYSNPRADMRMKWAKACRGTCQAGTCHVSPYELKQCLGGY